MKKLVVALMLGLFSLSSIAMHHEGGEKHKAKVHKKHTKHNKHKKARHAAKQA